MTKEEYEVKRGEQYKIIKEANSKIAVLQAEFAKSNAKFSVGQKIKASHGRTLKIGIVKEVIMKYGSIAYRVNLVKSDGKEGKKEGYFLDHYTIMELPT